MHRNPRDAAPNGGGKARGAAPASGGGNGSLSAAEVARYLRRHPDFLNDYPDLLGVLAPPGRDHGDGVVDLQQAMVQRLRREVEDVTAARDELVVSTRQSRAAQARVHQAVIALFAARSFEQLIEIVTTDLAVMLDLDVVTLGVERTDHALPPVRLGGICQLAPDTVDCVIGVGRDVMQRPEVRGDPEIFGAGAGLVASDALVRLSISRSTPPAMLALGSRQPGQFHPGQGSELLGFLGKALEGCIRGWLNLPG
ncbi:MAG: DUF484 family protein [Kiloniellales bacterium]